MNWRKQRHDAVASIMELKSSSEIVTTLELEMEAVEDKPSSCRLSTGIMSDNVDQVRQILVSDPSATTLDRGIKDYLLTIYTVLQNLRNKHKMLNFEQVSFQKKMR